jgi:hypothetical protein
MVAFVLAAAIVGGGFLVLTDRTEIALSRPAVTLADVARVAGTKDFERLATVEIAHLPIGRDRLSLSRRAIAMLVRRAIPGIVVGEGDARVVTFRLIYRDQPSTGSCLVTSAALAAGAAITRDKVATGPCAVMAADVRYDAAHRTFVARRDLPAGSALGRLVAPAPDTVARGDALTLVSRVGPVTVERPVAALQPSREGRRVFVRDGGGRVFAAPVAMVKP